MDTMDRLVGERPAEPVGLVAVVLVAVVLVVVLRMIAINMTPP